MKDLIRRSKKGDKEAFSQLMDANRQMLYHTAMLMVKKEEDALDALQDTVLSCWENMPLLRQDKYFRTWLTKILYNKCYDILRMRQGYISAEEIPEKGAEEDWDTGLDVRKALRKLPHDDHLLLSLYYYDDFSTRQIADILSISEGAVRTRLTRSRERFKHLYTQKESAVS